MRTDHLRRAVMSLVVATVVIGAGCIPDPEPTPTTGQTDTTGSTTTESTTTESTTTESTTTASTTTASTTVLPGGDLPPGCYDGDGPTGYKDIVYLGPAGTFANFRNAESTDGTCTGVVRVSVAPMMILFAEDTAAADAECRALGYQVGNHLTIYGWSSMPGAYTCQTLQG